jgi:hypothetical protein
MVSMLGEAVQIGKFKSVWPHDQSPGPMNGPCLAEINIIDIECFANIGGNTYAV